MSVTKFIMDALKIEPPIKGDEKGYCTVCGGKTCSGSIISKTKVSMNGESFTDWNSVQGMRSKDGIICPYCLATMSLDKKMPAKLFKSRLRRCLITQSGKVFMIGTHDRLKWMLNHLPDDEPFVFMDSRRNASKHIHHIWKSKISMSNKAFYYCSDAGNHLIRLNRLFACSDFQDLTCKEAELKQVLVRESIKEEESLHPANKHYDKK